MSGSVLNPSCTLTQSFSKFYGMDIIIALILSIMERESLNSMTKVTQPWGK
jgi:hypothetical protein